MKKLNLQYFADETLPENTITPEINYETEAYYVLYNFESGENFPEEMYRVAKITDGVLRTMIVKK